MRYLLILFFLAGCHDQVDPSLDSGILYINQIDLGTLYDSNFQDAELDLSPTDLGLLDPPDISVVDSDPPCLHHDIPCNDIDDDCDGSVDEKVWEGSCHTGMESYCSRGERVCVDGRALCQPIVSDLEDYPDGVDADCDFKIDEDTLPQELESTCADDPDFICIPGNTIAFEMGLELEVVNYAAFRVLRREFSIGDLERLGDQYQYVTRHQDCQHSDCPLELVSVTAIATILNQMSLRQGLQPCYIVPEVWFGDEPPYELGAINLLQRLYTLLDRDFAYMRRSCNGYRLPTYAESLVMSTSPSGVLNFSYRPPETQCVGTLHRQKDLNPNYLGMTGVIDNLSEFVVFDQRPQEFTPITHFDIGLVGMAYSDMDTAMGWAEEPTDKDFCHNQKRTPVWNIGAWGFIQEWGILGVGFRPVRAE